MMSTPVEHAYHDLADAIVIRAADDYRNALDGISYNSKPPEKIIKELEKFFRSDYFAMLTKVKGDYLIEKLKQEHLEKERSKNENNVDTGNP